MQVIEGWFEAPITSTVSFLLRRDAVATLRWSGNSSAAATTVLAAVTTPAADVLLADGTDAAAKPVLVELWNAPSWRSVARSPIPITR